VKLSTAYSKTVNILLETVKHLSETVKLAFLVLTVKIEKWGKVEAWE
jgi:hypothetical protein